MRQARARIRGRRLATIVVVACVLTPFFNILTVEASVREVVQGVVDAGLSALAVGGYLLFLRPTASCFFAIRDAMARRGGAGSRLEPGAGAG